MVARLRVLLAQVNTYLVLAAVTVTVATEEIVPVLDSDKAAVVASVSAKAVAWLTAAATIVRRSTEVAPEDRGLLPQDWS